MFSNFKNRGKNSTFFQRNKNHNPNCIKGINKCYIYNISLANFLIA